jgi:hypothetical protein
MCTRPSATVTEKNKNIDLGSLGSLQAAAGGERGQRDRFSIVRIARRPDRRHRRPDEAAELRDSSAPACRCLSATHRWWAACSGRPATVVNAKRELVIMLKPTMIQGDVRQLADDGLGTHRA